jgi:tRNA 2-thiocytidine biosynthesis protein TtcA
MPCNLCGSQDNLQRQAVKAMLAEWERVQPGRVENIFRALTRVQPSQLADRDLFDFAGLGASATVHPALHVPQDDVPARSVHTLE